MATYRVKKYLSLYPSVFFLAIAVAGIVLSIAKGTPSTLIVSLLSSISSILLFAFYRFIRLETTEHFVRPPTCKPEKVPWEHITDVTINEKSTISGYIMVSISYHKQNEDDGYFMVGDWFDGLDDFISEVKEKAHRADIQDLRQGSRSPWGAFLQIIGVVLLFTSLLIFDQRFLEKMYLDYSFHPITKVIMASVGIAVLIAGFLHDKQRRV